MDELKNKKAIVTETDIEDVVRRESEGALRRFRSGDFAARLKARPEVPSVRRPFFLLRKPVFVPVLGVLVLSAVFLFIRTVGPGTPRREAGLRFMTDFLGQMEYFRTGDPRLASFGPGTASGQPQITPFAAVFFRAIAGSNAESEFTSPLREGPPLRPLFSPKERFKILYGDQVILRVLTNIVSQKEV